MDEHNKAKGRCTLPISRRRFVQGLAAGGAVAALDWRAGWAFAETGQQQTLATLTGKDFCSHGSEWFRVGTPLMLRSNVARSLARLSVLRPASPGRY